MPTVSSDTRVAPMQALILEGPEGDGLRRAALRHAAAWFCPERDAPCLHCAACRKVLDAAHADLTVIDEGQEPIKVDAVRALRRSAFVRPFDGLRKGAVILHAHNLGDAAQNALLTLLEEPPAYYQVILCTDRAETLLPTVRSRCACVRLPGEGPQAPDEEDEAAARLYCDALSDPWRRAETALGWSRLPRDRLLLRLDAVLLALRELWYDADEAERQRSLDCMETVQHCQELLARNVSAGSVCGLLAL